MVSCGRTAHLTRDEIQKVVDHYKTKDGRIRYKEFCDLMENGMCSTAHCMYTKLHNYKHTCTCLNAVLYLWIIERISLISTWCFAIVYM